MKNTFKNTVKGAAIVSLALAAVASTQAQTTLESLASTYAQGDLIAGFTTGSGQDLIVNLGTESTLASGQYWNLSSLLNLANISSEQFGVIGVSGSAPNTAFTTRTGSSLPTTLAGLSAYNGVKTPVNGIGNEFLAASSSATPTETASGTTSWYGETVGGGTSTYKNAYGNPNGQVGEDTLDFYSVTQGGTAPTVMNTFTLQSDGDLVYGTVSAVPEPTTYGLVAAAGLLVISLRNQFSRKQA
jgi:hypothetical protein